MRTMVVSSGWITAQMPTSEPVAAPAVCANARPAGMPQPSAKPPPTTAAERGTNGVQAAWCSWRCSYALPVIEAAVWIASRMR